MKISMDEILLRQALEKVSKVSPKDCIATNGIISFLVNEKEIGKAIGKKASNIKELEKKLKKRVEIIGFYKKPEDIIKNTFKVELKETNKKGKKLIINLDQTSKKKVMSNIGRLKRINELIERNYKMNLILN